MAQMYRFERNGVIKFAELIEQNDKAKTVTLKLQDGTLKATMLSTFKRWWKPCDDVVTEQEQPKEEEQQDNEVQQNEIVNNQEETSNADVKNDAVEKKVKKVKKEKKEKKEDTNTLSEKERLDIRDTIIASLKSFNDIDVYINDNYPLTVHVRFKEKRIFCLGFYCKRIRFRFVKKLLADVECNEVKGYYSATSHIEYTDINVISSYVQSVIDNFSDSEMFNKVKKEKKSKKKEEKEEQANG